jgi:hypothetical protein
MKRIKIKMFRFIESDGSPTIGGTNNEEVEKFVNSGVEIVKILQSESAFYKTSDDKNIEFIGWNLTITIFYK